MKAYLLKVNKRHSSTFTPTIPMSAGIDVKFKEGTSIEAPSLLLQMDDTIFDYNYVALEIGTDRRFYFVDQCVIVAKSLYRLDCTMDYLATYRSGILSNKCFVQYSESDYDSRIADSRLSNSCFVSREDDIVLDLFSNDLSTSGTFIVEIAARPASSKSTYNGGMTTTVQMTPSELVDLRKNLWGDVNITTAIKNILNDAMSTVVRCMWIPFSKTSNTSINVAVGSSSTSQTIASLVSLPYGYDGGDGTIYHCPIYKGTLDLSDLKYTNDFRACEPYTTFHLFLPFVGIVPVNASDILKDGGNSIQVAAVCDFTSGYVTYTIGGIATYTGKFGVELVVPSQQSGVLSAIGGAVTAAGFAFTGNYLEAGNALFASVITGMTHNVGTSGSQGAKSTIGMISSTSNSYSTNSKVRLKVFHHELVDSPYSSLESIGLPCMKQKKLGYLSGYTQTVGANIKLNASDTARTTINGMLDSGIWIE